MSDMTQSPSARRPVAEFGPYAISEDLHCSVAVWAKEFKGYGVPDSTVYMTTILCRYHDKQAGEWKETRYWYGEALPILVHALNRAHAWILEALAREQAAPS